MINKERINYSLRNLSKSKTRSILTILSIFVGITTIFIFISFGWGLYDFINDLTTTGSADKVIIQPAGNSAPGLDNTFKLEESDLRAVKNVDGVKEVQGVYFKVAEIKKSDELKYTFLIAYDPKETLILEVFDIEIEKGRNLISGDSGAVLGNNFLKKDKVFSKSLGINDKITIQDIETKVLGFYEEVGNPQDDAQIYISEDYLGELYPGENSYGWIIARVDKENIDSIIQKIENELRRERDEDPGEETFFVQSFQDLIDSYSSALNIVIAFVILIALISVFVSAINTSNTMITSILERTREIGILKSIGARNSEIFKIFLFESSFLGFLGGVLGVILGWILSSVGKIILANLGWSFLAPHFSIWLFAGCILFATLTGAISGIIPAVQASKVNPVESLRYE